jgi:hypothetical protein
MRKAKEYRTKVSSDNQYGGSSGNRKHKGDQYKLSNMSRDGATALGSRRTKLETSSEENILKDTNHSIVKSVTYTVEVGDEEASIGRGSSRRGRGEKIFAG